MSFYGIKIPANLDINSHLTKNPPSDKRIKADKLAYICSTVLDLQSENKSSDGYVPVYSLILHKAVYCYRQCLDYLIQTGILMSKNQYAEDRSKEYRFAVEYTGTGSKFYSLQNITFKRHVRSLNEKRREKSKKQFKLLSHLTAFFDDNKLDIDMDGALQWLEQERQLELSKLKPGNDLNFETKAINHKYQGLHRTVEKFKNRQYGCLIDEKGQRFHSAFTQIKKGLRKFITYDSDPLVQLDIRNCQPFLLLQLFKWSFYQKVRGAHKMALNSLFPELYNSLREAGRLKELKRICSSVSDIEECPLDFINYRQSVLNATFYKDLQEIFHQYEQHKNMSDRTVKKTVLMIFFDRYDEEINPYREHLIRIFREHYPTIYGLIALLKVKEKHQYFAWLMQRIESTTILHHITKKFAFQYPDAPVFTIHDCVATTSLFTKALENILKAKFKELTGFIPKLKFE